MRKYLAVFMMLVGFGTGMLVQAQEATEAPEDEPHRVQAWLATHTDEAGDALIDPDTGEPVGADVAFLEVDDGLISVWPGSADILYTGDVEGGFTGSYLVADPDIIVTAELQIVDDDTRTEVRHFDLFGTSQEEFVTYTRTDDVIEIWSESTRNFIETTLLGECLGRTEVTLSFGWAAPDVLMPIRFNDDGTVVMDRRVYAGGENEDISTRTTLSGTTTTVIIRTLDIGGDSIGFRLHGTLDGRDDCEMIYESSFTPFDADYETLLGRSQDISAEFERE